MIGQFYRIKLKVTLTYKGKAGQTTAGEFKAVQINLKVPVGAWIERTVIKHDELTMSGASTPPTEQLYVYAQRDFCPSDLKVTAALTY